MILLRVPFRDTRTNTIHLNRSYIVWTESIMALQWIDERTTVIVKKYIDNWATRAIIRLRQVQVKMWRYRRSAHLTMYPYKWWVSSICRGSTAGALNNETRDIVQVLTYRINHLVACFGRQRKLLQLMPHPTVFLRVQGSVCCLSLSFLKTDSHAVCCWPLTASAFKIQELRDGLALLGFLMVKFWLKSDGLRWLIPIGSPPTLVRSDVRTSAQHLYRL
jgi:hypothetical protein